MMIQADEFGTTKSGSNLEQCFKFVMTCEYEIFGKFPRTTGSVEKHSVG